MTCMHYADRVRCPEVALVAVTSPNDARPVADLCWQHGASALGEYAEKLGEQWGAVSLAKVKA